MKYVHKPIEIEDENPDCWMLKSDTRKLVLAYCTFKILYKGKYIDRENLIRCITLGTGLNESQIRFCDEEKELVYLNVSHNMIHNDNPSFLNPEIPVNLTDYMYWINKRNGDWDVMSNHNFHEVYQNN